MKSNDQALTDKMIKAIPHLISAKTCMEGCKKARIAPKTYYTWLKNPLFKDELKQHRDSLIEESMELLKGHIMAAVETLGDLLTTTESDSLKRHLAKDIIDYVIKSRELEDIEQRVSLLEDRITNRYT